MMLRRLSHRLYRTTRDLVWASPLARWPAAAHAARRLGAWARGQMHLAPPRETIGAVRGHQMWFGPGSECYLDMTQDTWEPGVTKLLESVLKPGMVVIDAGAHIGYFSLLAAHLVGPRGRVYAFEPAPANYDLLARNIRLNRYSNIVAVQKAVSDVEESATLYLHDDSVAHSLRAQTFGVPSRAIAVDVTTIDRVLEREGWPPVHLVKLDVEGAEAAALRGMRETRRRNRDACLIVEYIPHFLRQNGEDPRQFLDVLRAADFRVQMIADDGLHEISDRLIDDPNLRTELWCEPRRPEAV